MSKCEWKDVDYMIGGGSYKEFSPCDDFNGKVKSHMPENSDYYEFKCCSCGADIRKPEPEVIIKKSGETWVARYDGVDYLYAYLVPNDMTSPPPLFQDRMNIIRDQRWKPISEIKITDEIAKYRPMVTNIHSRDTYKLLGVIKTSMSVYSERFAKLSTQDIYAFRLATVSDLEVR